MNFASLRLWQYVALCVDSSANTAESSSSSRQGHGSMWYCALTRLQTLQGPAAAAGKDITERHEEPGRRSLGCILLSRTQRAAVHFVLSRGYCDVRACPLAKWAFPRLLYSCTRKCTLVDTCMCVHATRSSNTRARVLVSSPSSWRSDCIILELGRGWCCQQIWPCCTWRVDR